MIDQQHKQLLKQVLQSKFQTAPQRHFNLRSFFSMPTIFRWSLVPGLAIVGLATWTLFSTQQQPQLSFLDHVQAALADEVTPANDAVHHQVIQIEDGTTHALTTLQQWDSTTATSKTWVESDGTVSDRNLIMRNADGTVQHYETASTATTLVVDAKAGHSDEVDFNVSGVSGNSLSCVVNVGDKPLPQPAIDQLRQQIDAITNTNDVTDRKKIIAQLLNDASVQDLGEQAGLHVFALSEPSTGSNTVYEYAFNPNTFMLQQYRIRHAAGTKAEIVDSYTYQTNEYVTASSVPTDVWSTTGLTQISDLTNKPSGCYDMTGKKVSDLPFNITFTSDGPTEAGPGFIITDLDVTSEAVQNSGVFFTVTSSAPQPTNILIN